MTDIEKFKHVLEYFVAHLEYVNNSPSQKWKGIIETSGGDGKFPKTGCGYNGDKIQNQIKDWQDYDNEERITVTVQSNYGNYTSKKCYLNWKDTGINVFAGWENGCVESLYIGYCYHWKSNSYSEALVSKKITELGLFEGENISTELNDFYDRFKKEISEFRNKRGMYYSEEKKYLDNKKMEGYIYLLKQNYNLILTGAPGTGKTYLAKQIAKAMGCTENEIGFVQFHPSYDYTDFVEGLRPLNEGNGNVGFERMDGVFKEFCGRAMQKSSIVGFGPIYDSFLESLGEKRITIKSQQGKSFAVSVNSKGNLNLMTGDGLQPNGVLTRKEIETEFLKLQKNYLGEDNDNIVKYPNGWEDFFLSKEWVDKIIRIQTTSRFSNDNRLTTLKICRLVADIIQDDNVKYYRQEIEHAFSLKYGPKNESTKSWLITDIQQQINEGLKDNMDNNNGENARKGYYKAVAQYLDDKYNQEKGETCSDKLFVFIIDEINRGEISKIFGELFFSIDPGYRGEKGRVQTQYQNMVEEGDLFKKGFFVPENVYIIGTMNDIDRSVESMDFAFRRRFAFVEVKANENTGMLDGKTWKDDAIKRMNSLNAEIEKIDGLSSAYHIGASYFLKLDNYNGDWSQLWEYHLDGLLREYLRGTQGVDENMKRLENAYNLENATDDSNSNNG